MFKSLRKNAGIAALIAGTLGSTACEIFTGKPFAPPPPVNFGAIVPRNNYAFVGEPARAVYHLDKRDATNPNSLEFGLVVNGVYTPSSTDSVVATIPALAADGSVPITIRRRDLVRNETSDTTMQVPVLQIPTYYLTLNPAQDTVRAGPNFLQYSPVLLSFFLQNPTLPRNLAVRGPALSEDIPQPTLNEYAFPAALPGSYSAQFCTQRANQSTSVCSTARTVKP